MAFMLCGSSKSHHVSMDSVCEAERERAAFLAQSCIPEVNQDVDGMDSITVRIPRSRKGFGFTITGSFPVRVGQVKEGSPACAAGLRKDDCIVRINSQNVSRSIADSAAKLVRTCDTVLVLQVHRPYLPQPLAPPPRHSTPLPSPALPRDNHHDQENQMYRFDNDENARPVVKQYNNIKPGYQQQQQPIRNGLQLTNENCRLPGSQSNKPVKRVGPPIGHARSSRRGGDLRRIQEEGGAMEDGGSRCGEEVRSGGRRQQQAKCGVLPQLRLCYQELTNQEQERQMSIQQLVAMQTTFVEHMNFGLQTYLYPLGEAVLSPADHRTLFQNIEALANHADFLLQQFGENSLPYSDHGNGYFLDTIGALYSPTTAALCGQMENYCAGAKSAIRLLMALREDKDFSNFLKERPVQEGELTIGTFLQKPIEHMRNTVMRLQEVFSHTQPQHHDYDTLREVIEGLRHTCSAMSQNHMRRCRSTFSVMSQSHLSLQSDVSTLSATSGSSSASSRSLRNSTESMDTVCTVKSGHMMDRSDAHSDRSKGSNQSACSRHSHDSGISHSQASHSQSSDSCRGNRQGSQSDSGCQMDESESSFHAPHCGYSQYMQTLMRVPASKASSRPVSVCSSHPQSLVETISSDQLPASLASTEVEVAAIDSEVLDIQNRLLFASDIKSFKIASATRHMIYAGELFYLDDGRWMKLYVILLSDLLMITRVEEDHYITVLEEPIVLSDVDTTQFNCQHGAEFRVSVSCSDCGGADDISPVHGCEMTFTFRAPSLELKHTWQNILNQRIEAVRSQQHRDRQLGRVVGHFI